MIALGGYERADLILQIAFDARRQRVGVGRRVVAQHTAIVVKKRNHTAT